MFGNTKPISMAVVLTAALCLPTTLAAQVVYVTGAGDPAVDIPAVQAAVDQGGNIVLTGHFSFDAPPTKPAGEAYNRTVTVSKQVAIWGAPDRNGDLPAIAGGFIPFFVQAPGLPFAIQRVRFVRPNGAAIWVYAASGLVIANCRIEAVEPSVEYAGYAGDAATLANGIFVGADPAPISATHSGAPGNFSGAFSIVSNDIDVGGTAGDHTLGIVVFGVGKTPEQEVDLYVSGNNIRNITRRVIDVNALGGRVHIERNVITTGAIANSAGLAPDAINLLDSVSALIAHNTITADWATGTGILVQGNTSEAGATVMDNDVTMPASDGTTFGANSAGIMIAGFAQGNGVLNNRIRGRARAALVVAVKGQGIPGNNTFVSNDLSGFQSSLADLYVDAGVTNTVMVGQITKVEDHGVATVVVPMAAAK